MSPLFGIIWTLFALAGLGGDAFGAGRLYFAVLLGVFAVVETVGGIRAARGDMLSEKIWWWVGKHEPWRSIASGAFAIWLAWHVYAVLGGGSVALIVSLVLGSWLSMHFHARGAIA